MMHLAAQYLATAAISFIDKKEDDSHTNLGWINHTMETHPFNNGDKLGLNYNDFSLEWIKRNGNKEHLLLNNRTHKEIVEWLSKASSDNAMEKQYAYNLHYELPYEKINDTTRFKLTSKTKLDALIRNRDLAHHVISKVLITNNFKSSIRIWPHHFDTGAFVKVNDNLSIGLGMAIPDAVIDDFYFYISGYSDNKSIDIALPKDIDIETYYTKGFKGFALAVSELNESSAVNFCQAAIDNYLNSIL